MDVQTLVVGAGLLLVGFVIGRLTASKERRTVLYSAPSAPAARGHATGSASDAEIEVALRGGNKIEAIKMYREAYGTGLKESKDAVDALEARLGLRG